MMPGECLDSLCLMYGVKKCLKSQKCPKVPKVPKSARPVNYNYPDKPLSPATLWVREPSNEAETKIGDL